MKTERTDKRTSYNVVYFHTEGGQPGATVNEFIAPSANLVDFFIEVISNAARGAIIFPRIRLKRQVVLSVPEHCTLIEVPVQYDGNIIERMALIFRYFFFLLSPEVRCRITEATHNVSFGYDFFGCVAAIVRVCIIRKNHIFIIRGNRPLTVATSSRSVVNKAFALLRIKFYALVMRRMLLAGQADLWFQGQKMYETVRKSVPTHCHHRLHLLNAVLRDLPAVHSRSHKTDLVFLGHINVEKGVLDLIDAIHLLKQKGRIVTLRIVGAGSDRDAVQERIDKLGLTEQIQFGGFAATSETVARELASAKLFVLPSHTEGLPRAMIESMAIGTPVLVTPVGGIPFVVKEGKNGYLVDPGNVEQLARRINHILADIENDRIADLILAGKFEAQKYSFQNRSEFFLNTPPKTG